MTDITTQFRETIAAVEVAGEHARAYFKADSTESTQKADGSAVTEIDERIEQELSDYITAAFPDDAIVGEEGEGRDGTSGFVWHLDPIDGTDNFIRKIPFCAISVARLGDTPEDSFGIVHNPFTRQTFASLMEDGMYENEQIRTITPYPIAGRLRLGSGRGKSEWMKTADYNLLKSFGMRYGSGKAIGCCALELAYVAANRIDAFVIFGLHSYDYAAGLFLVRAAGGQVSVHDGTTWQAWKASIKELCATHGATILVSHPDIHEEMRTFIGNPRDWAD